MKATFFFFFLLAVAEAGHARTVAINGTALNLTGDVAGVRAGVGFELSVEIDNASPDVIDRDPEVDLYNNCISACSTT